MAMEGPLACTKAPVINVLFYSQLSIASLGHTATKQNLRVYTFQNILNYILKNYFSSRLDDPAADVYLFMLSPQLSWI